MQPLHDPEWIPTLGETLPIGDASPVIKKAGQLIGVAGKNSGFIIGVLALTVGDLFLGQNFYQTELQSVSDAPIFDEFWVGFITPRFLIALLISSCFSSVQMIGINMMVRGVKWSQLSQPGHKLGAILVSLFFVADFYFNFGGAAELFGEVQSGTVLPVEMTQVMILLCLFTALLGSFGALILYMFLDVGEPLMDGDIHIVPERWRKTA